jgi:hypothetical protein
MFRPCVVVRDRYAGIYLSFLSFVAMRQPDASALNTSTRHRASTPAHASTPLPRDVQLSAIDCHVFATSTLELQRK